MKTIENKKISAVDAAVEMKNITAAGGSFQLTVTGTSMTPTYTDRRTVVLIGPAHGRIRSGDVLLVEYPAGHCVLHRAVRVTDAGFILNGDALKTCEGPVPREMVIGRVNAVLENGKIYSSGGLKLRAQSAYRILRFRFRSLATKLGRLFR